MHSQDSSSPRCTGKLFMPGFFFANFVQAARHNRLDRRFTRDSQNCAIHIHVDGGRTDGAESVWVFGHKSFSGGERKRVTEGGREGDALRRPPARPALFLCGGVDKDLYEAASSAECGWRCGGGGGDLEDVERGVWRDCLAPGPTDIRASDCDRHSLFVWPLRSQLERSSTVISHSQVPTLALSPPSFCFFSLLECE